VHRWEAEQGFRFLKSEMALESPRLWFWDNRMKLMAIVTLAYDFLLRLLNNWKGWIQVFFKQWCHRNCLFVFWAQNSG